MIETTATEIKNRLGRYLEQAQREPVFIKKSGRWVAVVVSYEDYKRLTRLEDKYWAEKTLEAEKEGFVGEKESLEFLKNRLEEAVDAEA
ncbi:MAG: type II toxin-antitoxin system prevent-host-death family antitoxin [Candidatus Desulfofervidaceae bacterium]|nr:type II toxin-antitoxin system prevent-host-death family antitoxin [Candidatus Desulfofervidaceae bacterium]MDL1970173.1 type II toxin-antitoxin system prevent-host-death family antitoxin [Candidatus Desulfofervidaceae bacterium]